MLSRLEEPLVRLLGDGLIDPYVTFVVRLNVYFLAL